MNMFILVRGIFAMAIANFIALCGSLGLGFLTGIALEKGFIVGLIFGTVSGGIGILAGIVSSSSRVLKGAALAGFAWLVIAIPNVLLWAPRWFGLSGWDWEVIVRGLGLVPVFAVAGGFAAWVMGMRRPIPRDQSPRTE